MTKLTKREQSSTGLSDLSQRPTEELKEELARSLEVTVENLARMASIVAELERRGVDLSELRLGLTSYLRQIAHGRLSARAVVRFAERPFLLRRVSDLPVEEQDRLAAGGTVQLAVWQGETVTHRMVDPLDLSADQVRAVFGSGTLRSVEQQVPLLEDQRVRSARRGPSPGRLRADPARGGLVFRRTLFPVAEITRALSELAGPESDTAQEATIVAKVSEAQAQRLRIAAAHADTSMSELIRRALRAQGLI